LAGPQTSTTASTSFMAGSFAPSRILSAFNSSSDHEIAPRDASAIAFRTATVVLYSFL
jgi:hypothetical protein